MTQKTIGEVPAENLEGRRVVVRADLNVPLDEDGRVTDDTRIRASLPTLELLRRSGARVVLLSHLGRPKGSRDPRYSLLAVADRLRDLLGPGVGFAGSPVGDEVRSAVGALSPGGILLLENTRFLPGETTNDPELAETFASYGDLFVNDAFGAAHRAHASTVGVADRIRARGGEAVAGLLMERELRFLGRLLEEPERPFVAVLGGAKISGKIEVIQALVPRVDRLLVGGAMANTFFRAIGLETGASLVEAERVDLARETLEEGGDRIQLPVDCVVAHRLEDGVETRMTGRDAVGAEERIGDIGPASRAAFAQEVEGARTVFWNGPMGRFEAEPFREGTVALARSVAAATDLGALTVVGGGDSVAAADVAGVRDRLTHLSTGGGASLEFLAGAELPGVLALTPEGTADA